jgi:uncharacterized protein YbgA (DUF1722 family)/uncharacterized protein YbbK (DUF523 family)
LKLAENALALGSWRAWHSSIEPPRIGVSTCLLGENVRYDGGHARDRFVSEELARWCELVPTCPEMAIGMGSPRPAVRLIQGEGGVRLVDPKSGTDYTAPMQAFAEERCAELLKLGLDGYILKKNSPSCGLERIRVSKNGMPLRRDASGLYAAELSARAPGLPVEEDGRLNDPGLRENFLERVFTRNRWRGLLARGRRRAHLVAFHTAHKFLIRAHDESGYQALGKLVGSAGRRADGELFTAYEQGLQLALSRKATKRKHANVLYHALGYLKKALEPGDKSALIAAIEDYRRGLLPLVVPLSLIAYEARRHGVDYLACQLYFDPHPRELMLRNHV